MEEVDNWIEIVLEDWYHGIICVCVCLILDEFKWKKQRESEEIYELS